ncbi:MAG: hypothetical protein ACH6QR_00425 [Candidatus Carsonella ruddii]
MNFFFINNLKLIFLKLVKKIKLNYFIISYNIFYYLFFFFYKINFKNLKNINNDYFIIKDKCNFLMYEILFYLFNKKKIKISKKIINLNKNNIILISIKNNIIKNKLIKKINILNNKIWFLKKITYKKLKNILTFNFFFKNTIFIFKNLFNMFYKKIIKKKFNYINWNTIGPINELDIINLKKSFKISANSLFPTIIFFYIYKKNIFYIKNNYLNYFLLKKINFKIKNKYILYFIKNYFFFFLSFINIIMKFNKNKFVFFIKNINKNFNLNNLNNLKKNKIIFLNKKNFFLKNIYLFKPFNYLEKIISINLMLKIKKKSFLILFKNNVKKNIFINVKNIIKGCYELTFNYFKNHIIIVSSSNNLEIVFCCYFYLKKYFNIKIISIYCIYLFNKQNKYYKNILFKNKIIIINNIISFKNYNMFLLNYNFKNIKKKKLIKNLIKICLFIIKL